MLENGASAELYFSNTALAMQRTATEYLAAPGWGILALIALATLVLALVSCLVFSVSAWSGGISAAGPGVPPRVPAPGV